jgi:hypothetical protein
MSGQERLIESEEIDWYGEDPEEWANTDTTGDEDAKEIRV